MGFNAESQRGAEYVCVLAGIGAKSQSQSPLRISASLRQKHKDDE